MPANGNLTTTVETVPHTLIAPHDYLVADPESPAESSAWLAFQVAADHEEEARALARQAH